MLVLENKCCEVDIILNMITYRSPHMIEIRYYLQNSAFSAILYFYFHFHIDSPC